MRCGPGPRRTGRGRAHGTGPRRAEPGSRTIVTVPTVERLPYAPWRQRGGVANGEFRWRLGVRPLGPADWIEFGADCDGADGWIAEKQRLRTTHPATTFATLDDIVPEALEVADALVGHLATRWPDHNRVIDDSLHPLDAASRLVPEDLTLLVERDGRLVFGGGSVCFPNRWDLRSKLGRTMSEVHAPVARLNEQLAIGVDGFFERLTPARSYWRLGWGIIDVADGYTPVDGTGPPRPACPQVDELFVRVERETLRRFATTHCVLFTIRTYIAPITAVLADASSPESASALRTAVSAMTEDVRRYKDIVHLADAIATDT